MVLGFVVAIVSACACALETIALVTGHNSHGKNSGYAPIELGAAAAEGGFHGKCYLCGEAGHMRHDCPKAKGN